VKVLRRFVDDPGAVDAVVIVLATWFVLGGYVTAYAYVHEPGVVLVGPSKAGLTTVTAAQADAAKRKLTADYVTLYTTDSGKVQLDYQNFVACNNFGSCRTSSQDLLNDLQAFQSDRKTAKVPSDLAGVDADLGDALSAAIAATQQVISAMDSDDLNKFKDGERKVDAAMLNIAKAQVALGNHVK